MGMFLSTLFLYGGFTGSSFLSGAKEFFFLSGGEEVVKVLYWTTPPFFFLHLQTCTFSTWVTRILSIARREELD